MSGCIFRNPVHARQRSQALWAYLDDLYIWIKPHLAMGATRTINVELQPSKMQIWTASYTSPVPPAFLSKAKRSLKCFGSPSTWPVTVKVAPWNWTGVPP